MGYLKNLIYIHLELFTFLGVGKHGAKLISTITILLHNYNQELLSSKDSISVFADILIQCNFHVIDVTDLKYFLFKENTNVHIFHKP